MAMRPFQALATLLIFASADVALAEQPTPLDVLAGEYAGQVRPLVVRHCLECHSTAAKEGELDLERFAKLDDVRPATKTWLKVAEMLDNGEMPPKDAEPLPPDQKKAAARLDPAIPRSRSLRQRGRPRTGRSAAAEQCRVHVHGARSDRAST